MKVLTQVSTNHQPMSTDDFRKATIIQILMDYQLTQNEYPMQSSLSLPTQLCLYILGDILNVFTNKSTTKINAPLLHHIQSWPFVSSATCLPHLFLMVATTTPLDTATHWCSSMPPSRTWRFPASDCHWPPLGLQPPEVDCCLSTTHSFIHSFIQCLIPTVFQPLSMYLEHSGEEVRFLLNSSEVRI